MTRHNRGSKRRGRRGAKKEGAQAVGPEGVIGEGVRAGGRRWVRGPEKGEDSESFQNQFINPSEQGLVT